MGRDFMEGAWIELAAVTNGFPSTTEERGIYASTLHTSPGCFSAYPKGIASFSPGLRVGELPWEMS
jgi:hypothetical protein